MRTTEPFRRIEPANDGAKCGMCGKSGLEWGRIGARRVLLNEIGTEHKCNPVMMRKHLADDFDEVA